MFQVDEAIDVFKNSHLINYVRHVLFAEF